MSKSRGNIVNPWEVMERHGADAVRLFLVSSSQVWAPRRFDEAAIRETAGRFLVTLKNVYAASSRCTRTSAGRRARRIRRSPIGRCSIAGCCRASRPWSARRMRCSSGTTRRSPRDASWSSSTTTSPTGTCACRGRASTTSTSPDKRAAFATLHEVLVVTVPAARAVRAVRHRLAAPRADGRDRAPRAVRPPGGRRVARGARARGGDGRGAQARDAGPRGPRGGRDQRAAAARGAGLRAAAPRARTVPRPRGWRARSTRSSRAS